MASRDQLPYLDDDFALFARMSARAAASRLNQEMLNAFTRHTVKRLELTGPQPHLEKCLSTIQEGPNAVKNLLLRRRRVRPVHALFGPVPGIHLTCRRQ